MTTQQSTFTAADGAVFIQRHESLDPEYAGCLDLTELPADEGGIELIQVLDEFKEYVTLNATEEAPSPIEFTITTYLDKIATYLERVKCPYILHVNERCDGPADAINNYQRGFAVRVAKRTNRTPKNLVMRQDTEGGVEQDFTFAALPPIVDIYRVNTGRMTTTEPQAANDVIFVKENLCGECLNRYEEGTIGMSVHDAGAGVKGKVLYTLDAGQTWTSTAAQPFANDEHVIAVTYFWLNGKTIRFLVARGSTDVANPAEVAYTDFNLETDTAIGATWTQANVGSTNGQFFFGPKSLYAVNGQNIWGVAGAGFIYKSSDYGVTWTTQANGNLTADDYYVITGPPGDKMNLFAVGENNAFAKTTNGGVTWSTVTGPSATDELLTLWAISTKILFTGDNAGDLWVSYNSGSTWARVTSFTGYGVGQVRAVQFMRNGIVGFLITNNASPVMTIHITRDAGRSWEALAAFTNAGGNALDVVRSNLVYAVGEPQSSLAMLVKVS